MYIYARRGAAIGGTGGYAPPPTFKSRGTSYRTHICISPPYFYHNIYFDWLAPTYKIVPAPLYVCIHNDPQALAVSE